MNFLQRLEQWGNSHHPKWMDIVRIALGIFLCYKGADFLFNMGTLINLMKSTSSFGEFAFTLAGQYVVFAHILGGFFLIIGLFTRFACAIQIPILLGAVIFVRSNGDMLHPYSQLILSILVLLLLFYFLIAGNGPWSLKLPEEERKRHTNK
jgi:putative oxidoreductase